MLLLHKRSSATKIDPNVSISTKRIAVLFHSGDRHYDPSRYIVHHLAEFWRADGHDVVYLFGVKRFVPADLILVHVDLSVVPEEYLEFSSRYPVALNSHVRDIRKSTISDNLIGPGDDWDGPVIVKSDLNYGGLPERLLQRTWLERRWPRTRGIRRMIERLRRDSPPFADTTDYQIIERTADVPKDWFERPDTVVEKFLPEIEGGLYHIRVYHFLGDHWTCTRAGSVHPIVKASTNIRAEAVTPPGEVRQWREKLKLDYGKIDYLVHGGNVVLLDANKTTGAAQPSGDSPHMSRERRYARHRHRAEGLYGYFTD